MSNKFILLITNNENSPYIVNKEGFFNNIVTMPSQIADTPADVIAKVTHIYYDFDKQIPFGDYQGWVNALRHYGKKLFPGIPFLKASEFFPSDSERVYITGHCEMTNPSHPIIWCPEKVQGNDGWVLVFKDFDGDIPQPLIADILKQHKYVHRIFDLHNLDTPYVDLQDDLIKHTGKVYIYNYCNTPTHAIKVVDLSEQLTSLGREVIYHISVDLNQEQPTMQNNEELKYEPTTSEAKTTQIVYAFAEHLTVRDRAFLKEVGEREGVYLEVREQECYSESELSRLVRGMSVPQLVLFFNVRTDQKEKIIDILRKNDVHGLVTFVQIEEYPYELRRETKQSHFAQVLLQATRPPRDWFELMDKNHKELTDFEKSIMHPTRLSGMSGDYEAATLENLPLTYEFEEAIKMIKTGDTAMRPLHSPVDSFISATSGATLTADKFWSKFNKARAEKNKGKTLKVNDSFTQFLGGHDGVTMGWTPTNEQMWDQWVIEGTALFPSFISMNEDEGVSIFYDLYHGRSVLTGETDFGGPFHEAYDTIFDAIRAKGAKVGFLTNADSQACERNANLFTFILNDMLAFQDEVGMESITSNFDTIDVPVDGQIYFNIETVINFADDETYTQESAALWNKLKAEKIDVLIVDTDAFEEHPLKDDILQKLNWLAEQQENFHWVALSLERNITYEDEVNGVEVIDLGDGPQE